MTKPDSPTVTFVMYSIPVWLDQSTIEAFVNKVPEIICVRRRTYCYLPQRYDLAFEFHKGTDVYKVLNITEDKPYVYIDHLEIRLTPAVDGLSGGDVDTVSYTEPVVSNGSTEDKAKAHPPLKLRNLNAIKAECCICRNNLDGPFSTPCWGCRSAQCYDCIRQQFRTAMSDFESFPARCCLYAMHPDVAKDILPDGELARYKIRFEEWLTKQPIYCPVPTCSTFIPPRLIRQLHDSNFNCPGCQTLICLKCKQQSHAAQPCQKNTERDETIDLMKKFGYKQCPKCGTAVGKMYGCSHVQCTCGAHWCWECQRKIDICGMMPCSRGRGEEREELNDWRDRLSDIDSIRSDEIGGLGGSLPETGSSHTTVFDIDPSLAAAMNFDMPTTTSNELGENEEVQRPDTMPTDPVLLAEDADPTSATISSPQDANTSSQPTQTSDTSETLMQALPFTPTDDDPTPENELINLDDPNLYIWESGSLNFGGEPEEEDTLDMWGCVHSFEPALHTQVPRHWVTASVPDWWDRDVSDRKIECMCCRELVKMERRSEEDEEKQKQKTTKEWRLARRCGICNIIVCRRCRNELSREDT